MPVNEPRIFLDFLQPLRGRDQKFKPCEAQVLSEIKISVGRFPIVANHVMIRLKRIGSFLMEIIDF